MADFDQTRQSHLENLANSSMLKYTVCANKPVINIFSESDL